MRQSSARAGDHLMFHPMFLGSAAKVTMVPPLASPTPFPLLKAPCLRCTQWDNRHNSHIALYTDGNEYGGI